MGLTVDEPGSARGPTKDLVEGIQFAELALSSGGAVALSVLANAIFYLLQSKLRNSKLKKREMLGENWIEIRDESTGMRVLIEEKPQDK